MTKYEAIEYGVQIMKVFPDDISTCDMQWVLRNLLESSMEVCRERTDLECPGLMGK